MQNDPKNKLHEICPHKIDFWQKCSPKIYFSEKCPPKYILRHKISLQNILQWNMPSTYTSVKYAPKTDFIKKNISKNILQWKIAPKTLMKNAKKLLEWKIPKNTCWLETIEHSLDCTSRIKNQSRVTLCNKGHLSENSILKSHVLYDNEKQIPHKQKTSIQLLLMWMTNMYSF